MRPRRSGWPISPGDASPCPAAPTLAIIAFPPRKRANSPAPWLRQVVVVRPFPAGTCVGTLVMLLIAFGTVLTPVTAGAQTIVDAARRRLLCATMGLDLTSPLGQIMFQRCLRGGPAATLPRVARPVPQLVRPVGPLVHPVGPLVTPPRPASGGEGCRQGYVWREATPGDHVCVSPATRQQARAENSLAASRINQVDHSYGPDTCQGGFVWRETSPSDHVCVSPTVRDQARSDNAAGPDRVTR